MADWLYLNKTNAQQGREDKGGKERGEKFKYVMSEVKDEIAAQSSFRIEFASCIFRGKNQENMWSVDWRRKCLFD